MTGSAKEARRRMEVGGGRLVELMIEEAVFAGAYSDLMRRFPDTTSGFGRLYEKHRARAGAFAEAVCVGANPARTQ